MGEILVRKLVHLDTDLFISIMFESGCTKFGIDQKAVGRLVLDAYSSKYTTIGLCISGYGAAEIFIDLAEELKHTEVNPMCSIH